MLHIKNDEALKELTTVKINIYNTECELDRLRDRLDRLRNREEELTKKAYY